MQQLRFQLMILFALISASSSILACDVSSRGEVESMIEKGYSLREISEVLGDCTAGDFEDYGDYGRYLQASQEQQKDLITYSEEKPITSYEELKSCGYHPQYKMFSCPIEIKQKTGYAGGPGKSGSNEHVLFCLITENGISPINTREVHVHDNTSNTSPSWFTSVLVPADQKLASMPLKGQAVKVKAILSWPVPADNCKSTPIWGGVSTFQIRLDP